MKNIIEPICWIAFVLIAITLAIWFCVLISNDWAEQDKKILKAQTERSDRLKNILGKTIEVNGKKYVAVDTSGWDGTVKCVCGDGPDIWMNPFAVEVLLQAGVKK